MDFNEGKHYRYNNLEFFAERGMITLIDNNSAQDSRKEASESYWRISPGDFMKRAIAAMVKEPDKYPSNLAKLRKLLDDAKEACLQAKRQGDPTDPKVLEHVAKHQKRRSALVLPGSLPPMPGQRFNIRSKGSDKATDILSRGVDVVPDLILTPGQALAAPKTIQSSMARTKRG